MTRAIALHTITAQDAAHVLGVLGVSGGIMPGGFTEKLIEAMLSADPSNQERLARGFEGLVSAVQAYQVLPNGTDILLELATQGKPF